MPGAIAASPVEAPIDVEEGGLPGEVPLAYYHGSSSPSENPELYKFLVERLANVLMRRVRPTCDLLQFARMAQSGGL